MWDGSLIVTVTRNTQALQQGFTSWPVGNIRASTRWAAAGFFTPKLAAAAMCRNFGAATAPNDAEVPIRWALWLGRHVPEPTSLTRWREQETVTVLNQQPSCCRRGELARWVMPQSKAVCNHCPRRQRHLRRLRARGFGNSNRSEGSRAGLLFGLRQSGSDHFPIWKG